MSAPSNDHELPLADAVVDLEFFCTDAPRRSGRTPERGEVEYSSSFRLNDGRVLRIYYGQRTYDAIAYMTLRHIADDIKKTK